MGVGSFQSRLLLLFGLSGCRSWREVDRLAGLAEKMSSAYAAGRKTPEHPAASKLSIALGAPFEWLVTGTGEPPGERRVRRAVAKARVRLGVHSPTVAPKVSARKMNGGQGRAAVRTARSAGAAR